MSQRYNDKIKKPKLQDTQLGFLKTYAFCLKIKQRVLGPGERALVELHSICLWEHIKKLIGSRKGAVAA